MDSPCTPWVSGADLPCAGDAGELASAAQAASDVLFVASGRQFPGVCETEASFGVCNCGCGFWPGWHPALWWHYENQVCPWRFDLGRRPIIDVSEVVIGDEVLDPSSYSVLENRWLIREDRQPWPMTPWQAKFTWGDPPPAMGIRAAKALACDLVSADSGEGCQLPEAVRTLVRQGVQVAFEDGGVLQGVGLREVDLFLDTYNPDRLGGNPIALIPGEVP